MKISKIKIKEKIKEIEKKLFVPSEGRYGFPNEEQLRQKLDILNLLLVLEK